MTLVRQLLLVYAFFITIIVASRKEKIGDRERRHMTDHPMQNRSYDYYSKIDNTEKWNQLRDEMEQHWKGVPSNNKLLFRVKDSEKHTTKVKKKKESNRNVPKNKQRKRKALRYEDYYEDYEEPKERASSASEMIKRVVPYLLQKYRPKRLHLYTNRKLDLDQRGSHISSSVDDVLNTGKFPGDSRYLGPLTPRDVIGKISTIPRRPCHGPACHDHHKGLVRFYWRRVIFPRNRTRTRQRELEENDEDYDDGNNNNYNKTSLRQRNRGRRRNRNRNRGRNRTRDRQQEQSRDENEYDDSNYEEDNNRNRNRGRTNSRDRDRQSARTRQSVRKEIKDYNEDISPTYKDRNDYEEE